MERCSSIELRQSLKKMTFFLLLSVLTTILVNILLPFFIFKTPELSISSSSQLGLLITSHISCPSDTISFQYSQQSRKDLQFQYHKEKLSGKIRTYTKDYLQEKNVSNGKDR